MALEHVERVLHWEMKVVISPSNSGLPHRHATITVQDKTFTEIERIAYQVMLGSDQRREGLNAMRHAMGIRQSCLFVPKKKKVRMPDESIF